MTTLISFTIVVLAWVFLEASATENSCNLAGSNGYYFLPDQHQALTSHSCPNQSRTVRVKCMILCPGNTQRQLNDPSSMTEGTMMVTKKEQGTSQPQTSATKRINKASRDFLTQTSDTTLAKPVDTKHPTVICPQEVYGFTNDSNGRASVHWGNEVYSYYGEFEQTITCRKNDNETTVTSGDLFKVGATTVTCMALNDVGNPVGQCTFQVIVTVDTESPTMSCPQGVFGLTNDSNARTSVEWFEVYAYDYQDGSWYYQATCSDHDEGRTVVSGDLFKAGTTTVTCRAWDAAGNTGQCSFQVTVEVCKMTRLGMESGAIEDDQITANDILNDDYANYGPAQARLNGYGSWCGKYYGSWIQVEFNQTVDIYGLIIQGRYQSDEHVVQFGLNYKEVDETWWMMDNEYSVKEYLSELTSDGHGVLVFVQTTSRRMIRSRAIQIHPYDWIGESPCMRFEVISCN